MAKYRKAYCEKKKKEFVKIPFQSGKQIKIDKIYANGEAVKIQKQIPELTQKIMLKLLREKKKEWKYK
jgi:hypothetical protein